MHACFFFLSGFSAEIILTPHVQQMSESFSLLSEKERQCQLHSGSAEGLFKQYTKEACLFECALRRSVEVCGCAPWDYPQMGEITEVMLPFLFTQSHL